MVTWMRLSVNYKYIDCLSCKIWYLSVFDSIHVWVCFQIQLSVLVVHNLLLIRGIQIGEKSKPDRLTTFSKCTMCADSLYFLYLLLASIWRILVDVWWYCTFQTNHVSFTVFSKNSHSGNIVGCDQELWTNDAGKWH
jgi:hypothetical protein